MEGKKRTYVVNYEINANGAGAIESFKALVEPVVQLQEKFASIRSSFEGVQTAVAATQKALQQLSFKPNIELTPFKDALAAMELNAAKTAARIRSIMETSLGGTRGQFEKGMASMGKGGWIDVKSADTQAVKENQYYSRLLKALQYRSSLLKKINEAQKQTFDSYADQHNLTASQRAALRQGASVSIPYYDSEGKRIGNAMTTIDPSRGKWKQLLEDEKKGNAAARLREMKRLQKWQSQWIQRNGGLERLIPQANAFLKANGLEGFSYDRSTGEIASHMGNAGKAFIKQLDEQYRNTRKAVMQSNRRMAEVRTSALQEMTTAPTGDFSGLVTPMNPIGINTMANGITSTIQALKTMPKDGFPLTVKATMTGIGEMSQQLVDILTQLQTKANGKPIKIKSTVNPPTQADINKAFKQITGTKKKPGLASSAKIPFTISGLDGMAAKLTETIAALQEIAKSKVVTIKTRLNKPTKASVEEMKAISGMTGGDKTASITANILGNFAERLSSLETFLKLYQEFKGGTKTATLEAKLVATGITEAALEKLRLFATVYKDFKAGVKEAAITAKINPPTQAEFDKINKFKTGKSKGLKKVIPIDVSFSANQAQTALSKIKNLTINAQIKPVWGGIQNKANEMKAIESKIPPIKIKLDITQAKATLNELISQIKAVSNQTIHLSTSATKAVNNAATTLSQTASKVRGANAPPASTRPSYSTRPIPAPTPQGRSWNRILYPLTGNTSMGATTPAAISMAKGFGVMYAVGGAMSGVSNAMSQAVDYQNTMETARAILGRNYKGSNFNGEFGQMEKIARGVGMDTKYTAPDVANATRFMAMAGLDIPMINKSLRPIADISLIGDNDLGEVADKMTNIQTAFAIPANKMRHLANQMTNTFTQSNTDMMMIAETMQYAAPMAHAAGANVGDVLAMVGTMGNVGIQASSAGTTLRMMYQNILKPNKPQLATWNKLGIAREDKNGAPRNMIDILQDVANHKDINDNNLAKTLTNMFRTTSVAGAIAVVQDLRKNDSLTRRLREENGGSGINGLSEEIANKKQNTIQGLWAQVTSAFTEDNLQVFEEFQGFIKEILISLRDFMRSKEAIDTLREVWSVIKGIAEVMGTVAKGWLWLFTGWRGSIAKWVIVMQFAMSQFGALIGPIKGIINVLGGFREALFGVSAAGAMTGMTRGSGAIANRAATTGAMATVAGQAAIARGGLVPVNIGATTKTTSMRVPYNHVGYLPSVGFIPGPIGYRNLQREGAEHLIYENQAKTYQRSRSYMTRGLTKTQRAQQFATIDRMVAETRAMQRATTANAVAMGFFGRPGFSVIGGFDYSKHGRQWQMVPYRAAAISQVMPFHQYSGRASAVLSGGAVQAALAETYRQKASQWNTRALQKVAERDAEGNKTGKYVYKYSQAQRDQWLRKGSDYMRAARQAEGMRAAETAALLAATRTSRLQAVAQRRIDRFNDTALLSRAASMGKLSWGNAGKGISSAFNAGLTAISMNGLLGSIKGGLMTAVTTLAKGLGMLCSPVGIAVTAFTALVGGIWYAVHKQNEANENLDKLVEAGRAERDKVAFMTATRGGALFEPVDTHPLTTGDDDDAKTKKWSELPNIKAIYDGKKADLIKYRDQMWAQTILPKVLGKEDGFEGFTIEKMLADADKFAINQIQNRANELNYDSMKSEAVKDYIQKIAERAAVTQQVYATSAFSKAQEQAKQYLEEWMALDVTERANQKNAYLDKVRSLAAPFANFQNAPSYTTIDGGLQNATVEQVMASKEALQVAYNTIMSYANDANNMWTGAYLQMADWSNDIVALSGEWGERIGRLINLFPITVYDSTNTAQQIYLMTKKDGTIDWQRTLGIIKSQGIQVATDINAQTNWLLNIYNQLKNNALTAYTVANVSFEEFRRAIGGKQLLKDGFKAGNIYLPPDAHKKLGITGQNKKNDPTQIPPAGSGSGSGKHGSGHTGYNPKKDYNKDYKNNYDRHTGRPTQIVINIDKLANFDKSEFLTADQEKMGKMVADSVSQGLMMLIPQINYALGAVNTNSGN